jgi:hypothetical protein
LHWVDTVSTFFNWIYRYYAGIGHVITLPLLLGSFRTALYLTFSTSTYKVRIIISPMNYLSCFARVVKERNSPPV